MYFLNFEEVVSHLLWEVTNRKEQKSLFIVIDVYLIFFFLANAFPIDHMQGLICCLSPEILKYFYLENTVNYDLLFWTRS